MKADHNITSPDMDKLYDVTVKNCDAKIDALAMQFTLSGARPDLTRIHMTYVCPSRAHLVDDALKSNQDATANVDKACSLPSRSRTEDQQLIAEAAGCK